MCRMTYFFIIDYEQHSIMVHLLTKYKITSKGFRATSPFFITVFFTLLKFISQHTDYNSVIKFGDHLQAHCLFNSTESKNQQCPYRLYYCYFMSKGMEWSDRNTCTHAWVMTKKNKNKFNGNGLEWEITSSFKLWFQRYLWGCHNICRPHHKVYLIFTNTFTVMRLLFFIY